MLDFLMSRMREPTILPQIYPKQTQQQDSKESKRTVPIDPGKEPKPQMDEYGVSGIVDIYYQYAGFSKGDHMYTSADQWTDENILSLIEACINLQD